MTTPNARKGCEKKSRGGSEYSLNGKGKKCKRGKKDFPIENSTGSFENAYHWRSEIRDKFTKKWGGYGGSDS